MIVARIISALAYVLLAPFVSCVLEGAARNFSAKRTGRSGTSLVQAYYDVRKLIQKEKVSQRGSRKLYAYASLLSSIAGGALLFFGGDLLMVVFLLIAGSIFMTLSIGKERYADADLMIIPLFLIVAVGFHIYNGSSIVGDIVVEGSISFLPMIGLFAIYCWVIMNLFRNSYREKATANVGYRGICQLRIGYERIIFLAVVALFFTNGTIWGFAIGVVVAIIVNMLGAIADVYLPTIKGALAVRVFWLASLTVGAANLMVLYLCF